MGMNLKALSAERQTCLPQAGGFQARLRQVLRKSPVCGLLRISSVYFGDTTLEIAPRAASVTCPVP